MSTSRTPSGGTARPGLARERVVEVALDLLDRVGLDGLTMRRLAEELGVKNPALYWHFRNKQELLDEMAAAIQLRGLLPTLAEAGSWEDWLRALAHERRRVLTLRRDGARVVAGSRPTLELVARFEKDLAALATAGFTPVEGFRAVVTIVNYVNGAVMEQESTQEHVIGEPRSGPARPEIEPLVLQIMTGNTYPTIAAAFRGLDDPHGHVGFAYGVDLIIAGLHAARD